MTPFAKKVALVAGMVVALSGVVYVWNVQMQSAIADLQHELHGAKIDPELSAKFDDLKKTASDGLDRALQAKKYLEAQQQGGFASTTISAEATSTSPHPTNVILKMKEKLEH